MAADSFPLSFERRVQHAAESVSISYDDVGLVVVESSLGSDDKTTRYEHNSHVEMPAASTGELLIGIALEAKKTQQTGLFDTKIMIDKPDMFDGSGFLQFLGPRDYTIAELVRAMMRFSDNTAAQALVFKALGGVEVVNDHARSILGEECVSGLVDASTNESHVFWNGLTTPMEMTELAIASRGLHLSRTLPPPGIIEGFHAKQPLQRLSSFQRIARLNKRIGRCVYGVLDRYTDFMNPHIALKEGFFDEDENPPFYSVNHQISRLDRGNGVDVVTVSMIQTELDPRLRGRAEYVHSAVGRELRAAYQA